MRKERWILMLLFLCLGVCFAMAQRVEYYRWTKTYFKNGSVQTKNGASGQFVTRNKSVCYDSDRQGYTVGNGTLRLISQSGSNSKYAGTCYYGSECTYTFYDDRGVLNIADFAGNVYVYKRAAAPNGRSTSSLIANRRGGSGGSYVPSTGGGASSYGSKSMRSSSSSSTTTSRRPKPCTKCIGHPGLCSTCLGKQVWQPSVGSSNKIKCPNCSHGECSLCGGTGYHGYYN